jgi:hypothetical protein
MLERKAVIGDSGRLWANKLGISDRCRYVAGDMFGSLPSADAYMMKLILQDWNDAECARILKVQHQAAPANASVFIVEHMIPMRICLTLPTFRYLYECAGVRDTNVRKRNM